MDAALKALAHAGRRRMLELVWDGERSSTDLARECGLSKPATSQHLKVLRDADLVTMRTSGRRHLYLARQDRLADLRRMLDGFWGDRLAALREAVEQDAAPAGAVAP